MWNNKSYLLVIVIALLAFAGIYYGLGDKETRLRNNMLDAVTDHEHEDALIYATKLMKTAETNPATPIKDAEKVIKESGQLFFYLQAAKSEFSEFKAANDEEIEPNQLYSSVIKAREYTGKATKLDPEFESALTFDETLDETQKTLLYGLASNVIDIGEKTVAKAAVNSEKAEELIDLANSSANISSYLSVQSAWSSAATPSDKVKQELESRLGEMDNTRQLVSDYKGGAAKDLATSLITYIDAVKTTIDALSVPQGSYHDFTNAANKASEEFKDIQENLRNDISESASGDANYSELVEQIVEYKIFENDSTTEILTSNQSLYER